MPFAYTSLVRLITFIYRAVFTFLPRTEAKQRHFFFSKHSNFTQFTLSLIKEMSFVFWLQFMYKFLFFFSPFVKEIKILLKQTTNDMTMLRRYKLFISVSRMIKGAGETSRRRRYFFSASPILLTDRYRRWWMLLQQRPPVHTIHFQFDSSRRRSRNAKKVSGSPLERLQAEKRLHFPTQGCQN